MKRIILILSLVFVSSLSYGQSSVKLDAQGNYVTVKDTITVTSAKPTGKTFTDSKGNVYPVMISKNGKLFVVRTSKTGNKYNQYLKPL